MRGVARTIGLFLLAAAAATAQEPAPAPGPAHQLYRALNELRVDPQEIYFVRQAHLRRDVVSFTFLEGKLAFLTAHRGRVLGAVFTGKGRVVAMPRSAAERHSLARFLGAPLVDEAFTRAYFRFTDETAAELRAALEAAGAQPLAEPIFGENWNLTVSHLNPWHSLRAMADLLAAEPRTYFHAGLESPERGAFSITVDQRGEEEVLIGQTRWAAGRQVYDVWAAFSRDDRRAPAPAFLPLGFSVDTTILPELLLEGRTAMRLRATRPGERIVTLELSRALRVEQVTAAGQPLEFFQNEGLSGEALAESGNDALLVVLPAPTRQDEELRLEVAYRGRVISDAGNGVFFVGERGSWYPSLGWSQVFVPFELRFRWPRGWELVATGRKVEEALENEWRTGLWQTEQPVPVAGFNLGEYLSETVEGENWAVQLYANRQWEEGLLARLRQKHLVPAPTPLPSGPGGATRMSRRLEMIERAPPAPGAVLKEMGEKLARAIRFYEGLLGPFPFEQLAVSQIPGSFGQGWPGLLYLSTLSFLEPADQQRVGMDRQAQRQFRDVLPYHEVAHQWWGNTISWASYRDQWIHEALAEYLALLYAEQRLPEEGLLGAWLEAYRQQLTTPDPASGLAPEAAGPLVLGHRLDSSRTPGAYQPVVYGKGAWVMHMIRMLLRQPAAAEPDARFHQLLRTLVDSYRHRPLSTADLEREVSRLLPEEADLEENGSAEWFFDQWVRGVGIPHYAVEYRVTPRGQGFRVRGTLRQRGVPEAFLAAVPLYAEAGGRRVRLGTVVTFGPETTFDFTSPVRPRRLLIDPENTLLRVVE